jgi:ketosteroid isomerase-like protein
MANELDAMIAAWQKAWFTKDSPTIAESAAADYAYVAPNGNVMDRAAILDVINDPTYRLIDGTHTEHEVVMLREDVALVKHRWQGRGTFRGQAFVDDHRCVMVCERSGGRWHVRYEHCSAIAK